MGEEVLDLGYGNICKYQDNYSEIKKTEETYPK